MSRLPLWSLGFCALLAFGPAHARDPFTGKWSIDLRSAAEKQQGLDCGLATFELVQDKDRVKGVHSMATAGCGRLNEGGPVRGVVVGDTAVLVVTSGRNGEIALGKARRVRGDLAWQVVEEVRAGQPDGDSGLILSQGRLVPWSR